MNLFRHFKKQRTASDIFNKNEIYFIDNQKIWAQ